MAKLTLEQKRIDILVAVAAYRDTDNKAKTRAEKFGQLYFHRDKNGDLCAAFEFAAMCCSPVLVECHYSSNLAMHKAGVQKKAPDKSTITGGLMGRDASGKGQRMLVKDLIARLQEILDEHQASAASQPAGTAPADEDEEIPF